MASRFFVEKVWGKNFSELPFHNIPNLGIRLWAKLFYFFWNTMTGIFDELLAHPEFCQDKAWRRLNYLAGQVLLHEGEAAEELFVVESGLLRVSGKISLPEHRSLQAGFKDMGPGEWFGETALLGFEVRRSATVSGVESGQVLAVNANFLLTFLSNHSELGQRFFQLLFAEQCQRLQMANERIEKLLAWGMESRGISQHLT